MDPLTITLLLIRTLTAVVPNFLTILNKVESKAGKPLDEMSDEELRGLLKGEIKTFDELLEEGRQRARDNP